MMKTEKQTSAQWFRELQAQITTAFERLEIESRTAFLPEEIAPGTFSWRKTQRNSTTGADAGGGQMAVMRGGRLFEKVGVNFSEVYGQLGTEAQRSMAARNIPELTKDTQFWASGISLVAHMRNPHVPAIHMNTRMFWTPHSWWFGGGIDLNPAIEYADDTADFHSVLEKALTPHDVTLYPRLKDWADTYFYIPHRTRTRGVGGIFLDDYNTGNWAADFELVQDIGSTLLPAFEPIVKRRCTQSWNATEYQRMLNYRGLYAEYNLVYDRGTKFGLQTGHDPNAVLMSLPPLAAWT